MRSLALFKEMMASPATVLSFIAYAFAKVATAAVYLWWNDLAGAAIWLVGSCLNPSVPIVRGIAQLHLLVLLSFAIALSFRLTSARQLQAVLKAYNATINFDDLGTSKGWATVPSNYSFVQFEDFYVFRPSDPELKGLISIHDLNCATSMPNALYGARPLPHQRLPTIQINRTERTADGEPCSFELLSLKIKPLDAPLGYTKINLRGTMWGNDTLLWDVDFPAGFHEMLHVDMVSFSRDTWDRLQKVEIWADFHHHDGTTMDWEYCLDDLEVRFHG